MQRSALGTSNNLLKDKYCINVAVLIRKAFVSRNVNTISQVEDARFAAHWF